MKHTRTATKLSAALVAIMLALVVATGAVAAFDTADVEPDNHIPDSTTIYEYDADVADATTGTVEDIVVDDTNADLSSVSSSDVTVEINDSTQEVGSITAASDSLTVTLNSTYSLSGGEPLHVEVDAVSSPSSTGNYSADLTLNNDTDGEVTSQTGIEYNISDTPDPVQSGDITAGTTVSDFEGNSSEYSIIRFGAANTSDFTLEVTEDGGLNRTYLSISNESDEFSTYDSARNEYQFNVSHDELDHDREINESNDLTFSLMDESGDNTTTGEFTATFESDDSEYVVWMDSAGVENVDGIEEIESESGGILSVSTLTFWSESNDSDVGEYEASNSHDINGTETDGVYVLGEDQTSSFEDSIAESASGGILSFGSSSSIEDVESGTWVATMTVAADDKPIPVYKDSAGDVHPDDGSYAVYNENGNDNLNVHFGAADYEDADSADVLVSSRQYDDAGLSTGDWQVEGVGFGAAYDAGFGWNEAAGLAGVPIVG